MRNILYVFSLFALSLSAYAGNSQKYCGVEAQSCVTYGAHIFQARCALCHGTDGLGEGILSLQMKNYPNTNLRDSKVKGYDEIGKVIRFGGSLPNISSEMPPWGDELTASQLESVTSFVVLLGNKRDKALKLLRAEAENQTPSIRMGRGIYQGRCSLCHGKGGEGDGKMARIIKNPPPFNLTLSRMPDAYLKDIIKKGGGAMGRSARMPPWGTDLSDKEVASVILYIKTLRQ